MYSTTIGSKFRWPYIKVKIIFRIMIFKIIFQNQIVIGYMEWQIGLLYCYNKKKIRLYSSDILRIIVRLTFTVVKKLWTRWKKVLQIK